MAVDSSFYKMNRRCDHTGKIIFETLTNAKDRMFQLKHRNWDKITKQRVNRNCKKPAQKRAYHCEHCNGYHLTSMIIFKKVIYED